MGNERFTGLSTEDLSDVWYALGGADTRHPGAFSTLADAAMRELNTRLGTGLAPFLEARFRAFRLADSREDAAANAMAAASAEPVRDNYPA